MMIPIKYEINGMASENFHKKIQDSISFYIE